MWEQSAAVLLHKSALQIGKFVSAEWSLNKSAADCDEAQAPFCGVHYQLSYSAAPGEQL